MDWEICFSINWHSVLYYRAGCCPNVSLVTREVGEKGGIYYLSSAKVARANVIN